MRIQTLKAYQRRRRDGQLPFADLQLAQRTEADAIYQRLCVRWGDDLPQWRRAILVGRAKDLVRHPRDARWGQVMRARRRAVTHAQTVEPPRRNDMLRPTSPPPSPVSSQTQPPPLPPPRPAMTSPRVAAPVQSLSPLPIHNRSWLDVRGVTSSLQDGRATARRMLLDIDAHAFGGTPLFSEAVVAKDLPRRWAWHLEIVPVP